MPDEWITISTGAVLDRMRARIKELQTDLQNTVERISGLLHPRSEVDRPSTAEPDYRGVLQELEAKLEGLSAKLAGLADAAHVLKAVPRDAGKPEEVVAAAQATGTLAERPDQRPTFMLSDMSPTSLNRMSEMATSLRVTDQQALERSIATQHFVDAKLRERWQFHMRRGRERRAVTFPGQAAI
jgi:hypothetical protein